MSNFRTKRKPTASSLTRKKAAARRTRPGARTSTGPATKQAKILALLKASSGATIAAMMQATGWQQHSIRGFLAGVVRKRLGLNLVSDAKEDGRVYRIRGSKASPDQTA